MMNSGKWPAGFKLNFWVSAKFLFSKKVIFGGSGPLSMLGLILGVAALVASQSVMRGFVSTLKGAVIDVTSDLQIVKRGRLIDSWELFQKEIREVEPSVKKMVRFANSEAVVASRGKVSGVLIQGIDVAESIGVLNFDRRFQEGSLPSRTGDITIGVGLSKKLGIRLNDKVYLAVPLSTPFESTALQRRAEEFTVTGIVDLGRNEWNERLILSNLTDLQRLTKIGDRYTGAFIKLDNSDDAMAISEKFVAAFEPKFYVNNWFTVNRNLLEAVQLEKVVIFFVVFLMVIIAAFNISSTLYVLIRSRYKDIAILKTLGFNAKSLRDIFLMQGFVIGTVGTVFGFVLGAFLCYGFMWLQTRFNVISGAVYRLDRIEVQISAIDLLIIYFSTLIACVGASYLPARRASGLTIIEGMKQD